MRQSQLTFTKVSDGTAGDMSVALQTQAWAVPVNARDISVHVENPATGTPAGSYALKCGANAASLNAYPVPVFVVNGVSTQPTGAAYSFDVLNVSASAPNLQVTYTPSSGGTGATPICYITWKE